MRVTLITLEQTGAGPVYSLEMAKAIALSNSCELQIIISEGVTNIEAWKSAFNGKDVDFNIVKAYNHTKLSVFVQFFNFERKYHNNMLYYIFHFCFVFHIIFHVLILLKNSINFFYFLLKIILQFFE